MPHRTIVIACLFEKDTLIANRAPLARNDLWDIVATENRSQEDKCRSRPSRSLSNATIPQTQARRSKAADLGKAGWTWTMPTASIVASISTSACGDDLDWRMRSGFSFKARGSAFMICM